MDWMQKIIQHEKEKWLAEQEKVPNGVRPARCIHCGKEVTSRDNLPFFEAKPTKDYDIYYCGCYGWD